ncbi:GGDEF domain-containing protein [Actinoplanes sp. TBRC 11911]|uniref:GGDEF domain-containing protein n=1 Tax=Actinoplanes sp. TBRC 11911 TaxID=2729386 RepID=UPI00145F4216|nr:GGDEF domain-containing protein [Actinoplanes sp. TBRC 11911]NMO56589.1 GGDEF domain-containing protein [Actinoplanes sp. TBRC 11911]
MRNGRRWFAVAVGAVATAHLFVPAGLRIYSYVLSIAMVLPCLVYVLRGTERGSRLPWWLLLFGMTSLSLGNALVPSGAPAVVQVLVNAGHALMLAGAAALVLRRGSGDVGGLLDAAVLAVALAGMLWTSPLGHRVHQLGSPVSDQLAMLASTMLLSAVLGAMSRLWFTDRGLRPLRVFLLGLVAGLAATVLEAWMFGTVSAAGRDRVVDALCMVSYGMVGLTVLDPAVWELNRPGPVAVDHLSSRRLLFHSMIMGSGPVMVGISLMAGAPTNGALLAVGSLLVTPLVMVRVGRLAAQRARAEVELRHRATHDMLTGLPNRAELLDRLGGALARERAGGRPAVVLLFCDLNGFKQVNDRLGHVAGDQLLTEVGVRVRAGLRHGDTLARYGGDEFLLLCEDHDQTAAAKRLTEHVQQGLARPFELAGEQVTVGSSIGQVISDGTLDADELISRADAAMYRAKQTLRGLAVS